MTRALRWLPLALVAVLLAGWAVHRQQAGTPLVVYCAHDAIFAAAILRNFTSQTGVAVAVRYDTEATKSLGLTELLVREKDAPRCDVFWNNELLGMLDLQERGILQPWKGAGWERIPAKFKDPEAHWTGFAARLRVAIFNREKIALHGRRITPDPPSSAALVWAIAKPLYGTTLTHYAVLWKMRGRDETIAWHRDSRTAGVREFNGNAAVKDAVSTGVCAAGFTDTDDFFEAQDAGQPVEMYVLQFEDGRAICIPNSVAIIRGTRREADARQLVDFLLSADTELALARAKSRQIPLGPVPAEQLPVEVRELMTFAKDAVDLRTCGPARAECLAWLKAEAQR